MTLTHIYRTHYIYDPGPSKQALRLLSLFDGRQNV